MMDVKRLVGAAPDWTNETWLQRFDIAASALFAHGFITAAQRQKITRKLEKQIGEGLVSGAISEAPPPPEQTNDS